MNYLDANTYTIIACQTNNVSLLVQALPYTAILGFENIRVKAALVATQLDNLETLKIIGKYLDNSEWKQYKQYQKETVIDNVLENRCIAWANEEAEDREIKARILSQKSFFTKTLHFLTDDPKEVLFSHPSYKSGENTKLLSQEHMDSINKKLSSVKAFIYLEKNEEGPKHYSITQEKITSNKHGFISDLINKISLDIHNEIFSSASVTRTMAFLNEKFSNELYPNIIDKENSKQKIFQIRNKLSDENNNLTNKVRK